MRLAEECLPWYYNTILKYSKDNSNNKKNTTYNVSIIKAKVLFNSLSVNKI